MAISGISGYDAYTNFNQSYNANTSASLGTGYEKEVTFAISKTGVLMDPTRADIADAVKEAAPVECETCKERKYQDGSDEMVSFKSASHIAPEAAAARVRNHEQEHVSNAYDEAFQGGGEVVNASVQIHTSTCPDCGRTYVSGGTTSSQIKYPNESNPYQRAKKQWEAMNGLRGANIDMAV